MDPTWVYLATVRFIVAKCQFSGNDGLIMQSASELLGPSGFTFS